MPDRPRARKLAVHIRQIAAETIELQVKDPRLAMVTVTAARVSDDLREATVFYTVYGSPDELRASAAALESARGLVRSAVGRRTGVKFTPTIAFVADFVPEQAADIEALLAEARAADAALEAVRAGASPAGDADPYRSSEARSSLSPDDDADQSASW